MEMAWKWVQGVCAVRVSSRLRGGKSGALGTGKWGVLVLDLETPPWISASLEGQRQETAAK